MDNQVRYRTSGCPMQRQEMGYDIGEPVGYAPGMQVGQPEYGMEMQPEYGAYPYRMPAGTDMPGNQGRMPTGAGMPGNQSRMPMETDMDGNWNGTPVGTDMDGNWNGMPGNQNGMSMRTCMPGNQNGMPMRTGMFGDWNGMSMGTDMDRNWHGTPGNQNGMPMRTGMPGDRSGMPAGTGMPGTRNSMPAGNMGWQQTPPAGAMPYYQMPGYPQTLWQEMESERDMQRLKEMYPDTAKELLPYVEEECDKMEYDGSVMFDEYPDRVMMGRIRNNIYDRVKDRFELPEESDQDEVFAMNQETRRRYPPRKNWLGDLVDVLLFQEMHRRRCRRRNCKGWR